jgi:hypothetical protein
MRKNLVVFFFIAISLITGCDDSPDDVVNAVADTSADFCSYETFKFYTVEESEESDDSLSLPASASSAAIIFNNETTDQLEAAGLTETNENPDLRVNFLWALNEATVVSTECGSYWYGYEFGYTCFDYESDVPVGTVIVDLVDSNTNATVFRGVMQGIVDNDGQADEERIANAVRKVFEEYPTNLVPCP